MRHILFLACLTVLCLTPLRTLQAQTHALDEGSFLLGGEASFTSTHMDEDLRIDRLAIDPVVQYFIVPGLAVGGNVHLGYTSYEGGFYGNSSTTSYGFGPAMIYFFGSGDRNTYPFLSGSAGVTYSSAGDSERAAAVTNFRGSGGVLIMLSRSVGLTGELFYQLQDSQDSGSIESNTFGLAFGISAFVF